MDMILLLTVNIMVNSEIEYKAEAEKQDHWQTVEETFELGTGDCEDYALAKYELLRQQGVKSYIAYSVTPDDQAHMVTVIGDYILDNMTNDIVRVKDSPLNILYTYNPEQSVMYFRNQQLNRNMVKVQEWKERQY